VPTSLSYLDAKSTMLSLVVLRTVLTDYYLALRQPTADLGDLPAEARACAARAQASLAQGDPLAAAELTRYLEHLESLEGSKSGLHGPLRDGLAAHTRETLEAVLDAGARLWVTLRHDLLWPRARTEAEPAAPPGRLLSLYDLLAEPDDLDDSIDDVGAAGPGREAPPRRPRG
jgi:hypothetical protein